MKMFMNRIAWFTMAPFVSALISFITIPVTTWFIPPEEYGKTSLFILLQTLAMAVMYLGMDHSYVREFSLTSDRGKLFANIITPSLILSAATLILGLFLLVMDVQIWGMNKLLFLLFIVWIPFAILERFLLLELRLENKAKEFAIFSVSIKLIILIATVILLLISSNYIMILIALVGGQIFVDIILILRSRKIFLKEKYKLDINATLKMLKYGLPMMIGAIAVWFMNSTDRLFLEKYSTYTNIGVYFAAIKIATLLLLFHTAFSTIWVPTAFKWYNSAVDNKRFEILNKIIFLIMTIIFLFILLFKEVIIQVLSPQYSDAINLLPFLIFAPIMYSLSETTGLGIAFSKKTHYNLIISLFIVTFNIVICFFLISKFDILGASIATGISFIVYFWIKLLVSRRLWFKFGIGYYVFMTLILLLAAIGNVIIEGILSVVLNSSMIIIVLLLNVRLIQAIKEYLLGRRVYKANK